MKTKGRLVLNGEYWYVEVGKNCLDVVKGTFMYVGSIHEAQLPQGCDENRQVEITLMMGQDMRIRPQVNKVL